MLVLMRRPQETLTIGKDVTVIVLGVRGNQVRIGVQAPKDVPVHRKGIYKGGVQRDQHLPTSG
jgi:carbon storage regulator